MTSKEAYIRFTQLINRNAINDNLNVDHERFVLLYNTASYEVLDFYLKQKNDESVSILSELVEVDYPLSFKKMDGKYTAKTPKDFYHRIDLRATVTNGKCTNDLVSLPESKLENVQERLGDKHHAPSFEYLETFYTLAGGYINIYVDNFSVKSGYLTYYKKPVSIDIEGYDRIDGGYSTDIHPNYNDALVLRILEQAANKFLKINSFN